MDLMYLNSAAVLHIFDKDIKLSAAEFLINETTEETWKTFKRIWISVFICFPDVVSSEEGLRFKSQQWKMLLLLAGIKHNPSGVQSHNAIGVGEPYHTFLRHIYRKIPLKYAKISKDAALALLVKALNDTAGPNILVPTLLCFGVKPVISTTPMHLPSQLDRMKAMNDARTQMDVVKAQEKVKTR